MSAVSQLAPEVGIAAYSRNFGTELHQLRHLWKT